jgi:exodeoxyribonuclease V beta subunit
MMRRAMVEHDYVVQLLFYLVAAHRFLGTRLVGYDYDRHLAGASYVFLRGLCGQPSIGWCNVTPPRSLIEAIDELFAGGGR